MRRLCVQLFLAWCVQHPCGRTGLPLICPGHVTFWLPDPYHTTCSKSLRVTVFAVVIGWLVSIVVMPLVYWRSKFDMVLAEPVAPPPPLASRAV